MSGSSLELGRDSFFVISDADRLVLDLLLVKMDFCSFRVAMAKFLGLEQILLGDHGVFFPKSQVV